MGSTSAADILFILVAVGLMALPPGVFAYVTWRGLFRRIRLEGEVAEPQSSRTSSAIESGGE